MLKPFSSDFPWLYLLPTYVQEIFWLAGKFSAAQTPRVVFLTLLYIKNAEKRSLHVTLSERSDGFEKTRFFASLRITIKVERFMTHCTSEFSSRERPDPSPLF